MVEATSEETYTILKRQLEIDASIENFIDKFFKIDSTAIIKLLRPYPTNVPSMFQAHFKAKISIEPDENPERSFIQLNMEKTGIFILALITVFMFLLFIIINVLLWEPILRFLETWQILLLFFGIVIPLPTTLFIIYLRGRSIVVNEFETKLQRVVEADLYPGKKTLPK